MNARQLAGTLGSVTTVTLAMLSMLTVGGATSWMIMGHVQLAWRNGHFPGDPPVPELCLIFTVPAAAIALSSWLGARWLSRRMDTSSLRAFAATASKYAALAATMLVAVDVAAIGRRSFGEWGLLRRRIQDGSAAVNAMFGGTGRQLSMNEYSHAQEVLFDSEAATFTFPSSGTTVRLRMMRTIPPYVGVDFGQGSNAVFEPATMIVTYAD